MGKSLVIVESPAKAKTINKYLGKNYVVKSSVGHVRDLPTSGGAKKAVDPKERAKQAAITRKMAPEAKAAYKKEKAQKALIARMGVDPENGWNPQYQVLPDKEKVVSELQRLAKDADEIYLATDYEQQRRGLMFVRSMPERTGMLFVYDTEDIRSMWMKNTYIPLDMVFARADGSVVNVVTDTVPQTLSSHRSTAPARYVLELNAGTARRLAIGTGSRILREDQ